MIHSAQFPHEPIPGLDTTCTHCGLSASESTGVWPTAECPVRLRAELDGRTGWTTLESKELSRPGFGMVGITVPAFGSARCFRCGTHVKIASDGYYDLPLKCVQGGCKSSKGSEHA